MNLSPLLLKVRCLRPNYFHLLISLFFCNLLCFTNVLLLNLVLNFLLGLWPLIVSNLLFLNFSLLLKHHHLFEIHRESISVYSTQQISIFVITVLTQFHLFLWTVRIQIILLINLIMDSKYILDKHRWSLIWILLCFCIQLAVIPGSPVSEWLHFDTVFLCEVGYLLSVFDGVK